MFLWVVVAAFVAAVVLAALTSTPQSAAAADPFAAFVEGAMLTGYSFVRYKHDRDRVEIATVTLAGLTAPRDAALRRAVRTGEILAGATNRARDWINEPAAVMTPATFAADAERVLGEAGLEVRVDGPAALRKLAAGQRESGHDPLQITQYRTRY